LGPAPHYEEKGSDAKVIACDGGFFACICLDFVRADYSVNLVDAPNKQNNRRNVEELRAANYMEFNFVPEKIVLVSKTSHPEIRGIEYRAPPTRKDTGRSHSEKPADAAMVAVSGKVCCGRSNLGRERHEQIDMDGRRQFGSGRRGQLEPGWRAGPKLGRRNNHRDAVASASIGTVNSITDSSYLSFESAGTNTVTTFLDNTGHLYVDAKGGEGGTILNIGGALTDSGALYLGNATLSASDEVTAASLDNTGSIYAPARTRRSST
jgi:hypothetical protein